MHIVDDQNLICRNLDQYGFELQEFSDQIENLRFDDFLHLNLKKRLDIVLINGMDLIDRIDVLENVKSILNTFHGAYVFFDKDSENNADKILEKIITFPKILGIYTFPLKTDEWILLCNQFQFFWNLMNDQRNLQNHIVQFSHELDHLITNSQKDLHKIKKVHRAFYPKREQKLKGLNVSSKYIAGDAGGAEFFDLAEENHRVFQFLFHSESYLISSAIMGVLNSHKNGAFNVEQFLSDAWNEINTINSSKKKKSKVEILLIEFDLLNLSFKTYGNSSALAISKKENFNLIRLDEEYYLSKNEKFLILSPGFLSNWREIDLAIDPISFLNKHLVEKDSADLMNELFFHLKSKNYQNKKDATVVMLEVNRHGIHKI